jgi:hypothetical protein
MLFTNIELDLQVSYFCRIRCEQIGVNIPIKSNSCKKIKIAGIHLSLFDINCLHLCSKNGRNGFYNSKK